MANKVHIGTTDTSWTTAGNWEASGAPASADVKFLNYRSANSLLLNLSTPAAHTGDIYIDQSFVKLIGDGTNYLELAAANSFIGRVTGPSAGNGSSRIMLNFGATAHVANIYNSAASAPTDANLTPIQLLGTSLTVNAMGGRIGVALRTGEVSTLTMLRLSKGSASSAPSAYLGAGATVTAQIINAGSVYSRSDQTAVDTTLSDGTYEAVGSGAHTNLYVDGGVCRYSSSGTITLARVSNGAELDFSQDARNKTITNIDLYPGAKLNLDNGAPGSIIFTNPIRLVGCGLQDVEITTPDHVDLLITSI